MSVTCRQSALRFLKIRPRSVGELKIKLQNKNFEAKEIKETLAWLENSNLLNDRAFTKSWIQYRLARPFGFRRIIAELKAKDVADEIIEAAVEEAKNEYSQEQVVRDLAKRRWERLGSVEPQKKKKRIYDFLLRRGFAINEVMKVLNKL